MAAKRDAKMQDRFAALEATVGAFGRRFDAIEERLDRMDERFDAIEERLDAMDRRFDAMDRRFDAMDQRFDAMDQRFDAMDRRFDAMDRRFDEMEDRLTRKIDVRMEEVRDLVRKSAEGYGATLEFIVRELAEFRAESRTRSKDIDLLLANHERRITTLEQRPS